jgi:exopolysaccharide biosynthesis polyprenyl glycosylphosphotransferase
MANSVLTAINDLESACSISMKTNHGDKPQDLQSATAADRSHLTTLIGVDFGAALIALPLSLILLAKLSSVATNSFSHIGNNLAKDAGFPILALLGLAMSGLYGTTRHALRPSILRYCKDILFAVGTGFMLTVGLGLVVHAAFHVDEPSATQLLSAVPVTALFVIAGRSAVSAYVNAYAKSRVLVVGTGALAERIAVCLRTWNGMEFVGRVAPDGVIDADAVGCLADLPELCTELHIDRVIIGFPDEVSETSLSQIRDLREKVHISIVPRYFDLMSFQTKLVDLSGIPMLEMVPSKRHRGQLVMKRVFDIAVSSAVLVILSPLFAGLALAVMISSRGPIFFKQERTGYKGRPFTIYKFRSLTLIARPQIRSIRSGIASSEGSASYNQSFGPRYFEPLHVRHRKQDNEARLTYLGRILRTTGLDELPQFFNVLKGDMSIVGPRPLVRKECAGLQDWQHRRFDMLPGITGLWQVSGRNDLGEDDLYILDYVYVTSWSMWWDIKILLETPRAMLHGFGAY